MSKQKFEFYRLDKILSFNAQYNFIIGERSNGKTYAVLEKAIETYLTTGKQTAYIRRYREDFRGKRGDSLFSGHVQNGFISKLSNDEWDGVKYYASRWYLTKYDSQLDKQVMDDTPFCFGFSLSDVEHDKSTSYPNITNVIFDEVLTRRYYLPNEFVLFMNCLSTIIRHRKDVTIFMLANTVNKYCPYFKEMGLGHIGDMELGKIDLYTYGNSELKVAVERCKGAGETGKDSDMYFAFDNPELKMITGGAWEIALYPHCPIKYKPSNILQCFFIEFNDAILQGEVIQVKDMAFLFIHDKTTPIHDREKDIIYTPEYSPRPNIYRNILHPQNSVTEIITRLIKQERIFYQDNEIGEVMNNYFKFCKSEYMQTK